MKFIGGLLEEILGEMVWVLLFLGAVTTVIFIYFGPVKVTVALVLLFVLHWAFWPHHKLPRYRSRDLNLRLRLRLYPGRGHATVAALWLRWGRWASFRKSSRSRASLSAWQRLRCSAAGCIFLGRAQFGHGLRLPLEEHVLVMAPPRTGKTGLLASIILSYPGPVVSTTTKADVFTLTSGIRARRGPVHVFNPQGIGSVLSTFRWSPLDGCEDPATAIRRADAFANAVTQKGVEDGSFWSSKASSYLRAIFHAAALAEADMRTVVAWALGDARQAEQILTAAGRNQWALELAELRGDAQKTAGTVRMTMSRALAFMTDPRLQSAVLPVGGDGLDFEQFLADSGTLYLIASSDNAESPLAPLFACLANELHYCAELIGQAMPSGRLDPPFLMALDEIVQTCPVPLDQWAADSGGKGIQLMTVAHGEAQLAGRWNESGKQVILDTASVKIFLGGITDTGTLEMASKLCGQSAQKERGHDSSSRHDVLSPDMIRMLPGGWALIIRGGLAPVVAKLPRAWKQGLYKRAARRGLAVARLTPAPIAGSQAVIPMTPLHIVPDVEAEPPGVDGPDDDTGTDSPWRS